MQWWCAALGEKWTWSWRAYPGVWLFVLGVAASRRLLTGAGSWQRAAGSEKAAFIAGVATLWISLDWPLGPIAAGHLASAHALQFLIITMISTPLLLLGSRTGTVERLTSGKAPAFLRRAGRFVIHPLPAVLIFNAIVSASHVPSVVDGLMPSAAGAFLVDFSWFLGGIIFWWPVIIPYPTLRHFAVPMKILYLLGGTLFHTVIGMIMLVSEHPMYGIYELAQPIFAIAPRTDQQVAGGVMELGVFFAIVIASGILFFRWAAESDRSQRSTVNGQRSTSL